MWYMIGGLFVFVVTFVAGFLVGKRHGQKLDSAVDKLRGVF